MNRASVFEWHKSFKEGRESMRDDERYGRSKEVRTPELIGQIKTFMDKDHHVSIETISSQSDVCVGTVHTIIYEKLKMRKICEKFILMFGEWLEIFFSSFTTDFFVKIPLFCCCGGLSFHCLVNPCVWYKVLISPLVSSSPVLWPWRARNESLKER